MRALPPTAALLMALVALACVAPPDDAELPAADYRRFVDEVQPVLEARCSNPACHGQAGRPLALFAAYQHRADAETLWQPPPIEESELRANFAQVRAFLVGIERAEDSPLLLRPLAPAAGGSDHGGGDQFIDASDQDYQLLRGWIADALRDAGADS